LIWYRDVLACDRFDAFPSVDLKSANLKRWDTMSSATYTFDSANGYLLRFLLAATVVAVCIAVFNYIVDPLQIFHRPWFYTARYTADPRLGDVGLIESQTFDTAFMGTSFSYAVRQSEIDEALGGKSLKLAISGGTSKEQFVALSAAIRKKPQRVVWQMDDYMFRDSGDVDTYLRSDLYKRNLKGLTGYLFNLETGRESLWIVLALWKPTQRLGFRLNEIGYLKFNQNDPQELNTTPAGMDLHLWFNMGNAKSAFALSLKSPDLIAGGISDGMFANFERDAVELIKSNPRIAFVIFFPPYSILNPVAMQMVAPDKLELILRFNEYQLKRLLEFPNVSVFDFRDVESITHNLDDYRDTIHYAPEINKRLLSFIAADEYRVNKSNPTAAIEALRTQIRCYIKAQSAKDESMTTHVR